MASRRSGTPPRPSSRASAVRLSSGPSACAWKYVSRWRLACPTTLSAKRPARSRSAWVAWRVEHAREPVERPEDDAEAGQHREAHHHERVGSLPHEPQERRAEQLKERHVIVEHVAIGEEPLRPGPDHVEVLRLVGVHMHPEHEDEA